MFLEGGSEFWAWDGVEGVAFLGDAWAAESGR